MTFLRSLSLYIILPLFVSTDWGKVKSEFPGFIEKIKGLESIKI